MNNDIQHKLHDERQDLFESIQRRLDDRRTLGEKLADGVVAWFGTFTFYFLHIIFFVLWITINLGYIPEIKVFDPFPFNLLTMTVSLEAIFLSIIVLINQNRASKTGDLRQEFDLQINMIAEQEITKVIHLVSALMSHMNVPLERDPELKRMMKPLDVEEIRKQLEEELHLPKQGQLTALNRLKDRVFNR